MSVCAAQAENGARRDTKLGQADAVKTEELGRRDTDGHMLGRGPRPQSCVAQDTGIRQAGSPAGTCNPSVGVGVGRWHPAGAGSGRFPGVRVSYSSPFRRNPVGRGLGPAGPGRHSVTLYTPPALPAASLGGWRNWCWCVVVCRLPGRCGPVGIQNT